MRQSGFQGFESGAGASGGGLAATLRRATVAGGNLCGPLDVHRAVPGRGQLAAGGIEQRSWTIGAPNRAQDAKGRVGLPVGRQSPAEIAGPCGAAAHAATAAGKFRAAGLVG